MSNCQQNLHRHFASACDRFKQEHNLTDLAAQIGMSADVLRNKFNPAQARHKLTATDLIDLYRVTDDDTLFDGLLFDCQLTAVRLPSTGTAIAPEARARQALNAGAQIMGVTAQATTILSGDRITKVHRNTIVSGIWASIEHLMLTAIEVENRYQAVPGLACAADMARAALGA